LFAGKGLAKMKDDDIEQLFECMNEELKLINQRHQEKKKETAEKAAMTRLHTNVTKFNEAINECKRKGQCWLHKKLPIPGWTNVGLIFTHGGGVARSFDLINRWDGKCVCIYLILCYICNVCKLNLIFNTDNWEAFHIFQSLEKILKSPESKSMTAAEIKDKARSDGLKEDVAFKEEYHKRRREREKKREKENERLQKEREQKEREAEAKRLKEEEEAEVKRLKEVEEARRIALEDKCIDEERVKGWVKSNNLKGKLWPVYMCYLFVMYLITSLFNIHTAPSKSTDESPHTLIKQRRKRKTKEELKQEDEERVKHWAKANSKLNGQERGEINIVVLLYVFVQ